MLPDNISSGIYHYLEYFFYLFNLCYEISFVTELQWQHWFGLQWLELLVLYIKMLHVV